MGWFGVVEGVEGIEGVEGVAVAGGVESGDWRIASTASQPLVQAQPASH